ncbi:MAG: radical SAM protein [Clostridiales bacterium]|nr:radical SAM protein [Clostridiales bacterium]
MQVSHICNIRCRYCFHSLSPEKKKANPHFHNSLVSMETVECVCEQLGDFPCSFKSCRICGMGEPLCHPQFEQICDMLKATGKIEYLSFFSNGLLLTRERSEKLISSGADRIMISLQGLNAESYRKICGADIDFPNFVGEIKYLYENRGNMGVHIKIADVALAPGEDTKFYDMFGEMCDDMFIGPTVPMFSKEGVQYTDEISAKSSQYGIESDMFEVCPQPFYMTDVTVTGDVIPCCDYFNPVLGNIHEKRLIDIWNGEQRELCKQLLRFEASSLPYCKNCVSKYVGIHWKEEHLDDCAAGVLKRYEVNN